MRLIYYVDVDGARRLREHVTMALIYDFQLDSNQPSSQGRKWDRRMDDSTGLNVVVRKRLVDFSEPLH
jgi:hypothetical protein